MSITEFLLARISEDEERATAALGDHPESGAWHVDHREISDEDRTYFIIYDEGGHSTAQAEHIAAWDPNRILRECEAKRRIVIEEEETGRQDYSQMLAAVCADHPDYDPAWAER